MKKKIAILHPSFGWGGAEAVCIWIIKTLKNDFNIDLITNRTDVSFNKINSFFGMDFSKDDFKKITLKKYPLEGYILSSHLVQRYFKKHQREYDLVISTNNEMDFGRKGIQYIHFPTMFEAGEKKNIYKKVYYNFSSWLSGYNREKMKNNLTLTNSSWTKQMITKAYGIKSKVVYPPIEDISSIPWDKKENGFLCVGRIAPEKKIEKVIKIIKEVKKTFPDIHLHIIGAYEDKQYLKKVQYLAKSDKNWIFFNLNVSRKKLKELISSHRYGIHAMEEEHFGMVVAEMIKATCIVFVPKGGGQVEIVGEDERIIYNDIIEASEKITKVLRYPLMQEEIIKRLLHLGKIFSKDKFMQDIRDSVDILI
jgi:glycosyltransferase involved in cell wall biosynthesis